MNRIKLTSDDNSDLSAEILCHPNHRYDVYLTWRSAEPLSTLLVRGVVSTDSFEQASLIATKLVARRVLPEFIEAGPYDTHGHTAKSWEIGNKKPPKESDPIMYIDMRGLAMLRNQTAITTFTRLIPMNLAWGT